MRIFIFCLIFFQSLSFLSAQNFLQLEKRGSFKKERFYEGDVLIFQLENDDNWYEEQILEIMLDEKLVLFEHRVVPISKIVKLRRERKGQVWRAIGNKLMIFGASFLGISLLATLSDWEIKDDTWWISGTALASGGLIRLIFNSRTIRLGKRRWLRRWRRPRAARRRRRRRRR